MSTGPQMTSQRHLVLLPLRATKARPPRRSFLFALHSGHRIQRVSPLDKLEKPRRILRADQFLREPGHKIEDRERLRFSLSCDHYVLIGPASFAAVSCGQRFHRDVANIRVGNAETRPVRRVSIGI